MNILNTNHDLSKKYKAELEIILAINNHTEDSDFGAESVPICGRLMYDEQNNDDLLPVATNDISGKVQKSTKTKGSTIHRTHNKNSHHPSPTLCVGLKNVRGK